MLVAGAIVLLLTVRNPSFDPDGDSLRQELDESGYTKVGINRSGRYVAALDFYGPAGGLTWAPRPTATDGKTAEVAEFVSSPIAGFEVLELDEGDWTFVSPGAAGATLLVFSADDPPTRIDWGTAIVFVPLLGAGVALTVTGMVQRRRGSA